MFTKVIVYAAIAFVACSAETPKGYTNEFDKFDVDSFVKDAARLKAFKECVLNDGECTPLAASFKKDFPDALMTNCEKCNEAQKELARKLFKALKQNYDVEFTAAVKKVDPEQKYWPRFEKSLLI